MAEADRRGGLSLRGASFALATVAALVLLAWSAPDWSRSLDDAAFDSFQRAAPRAYDPDAPVRIVDIDSAALAELGQWPWPRSYIAEMVDRLSELGAAAIAFDVLFAEPDRTSPTQITEAWRRFDREAGTVDLSGLRDHDALLAESFARSPVVLGTIVTRGLNRLDPAVNASVSWIGPPSQDFLPRFDGAEINLPVLAEQARGIGSMTLIERRGGIVRAAPLLMQVGERTVPALSVETLRVAQGLPGYLVKSVGASGEYGPGRAGAIVGMRIGAFEVPTRADGSLWVRYAGPHPERSISAARILSEDWRDPALANEIAGRLIFVGASAPGLRDLVATPLTDTELGVAVHAEVAEQIMAQAFLIRPDWARGVEIAALIGIGLLMAGLALLNIPMLAFAGMSVAVAAAFALSWWAFGAQDMLVGPLWPALGAVLPWGAGALVNYSRSEKERRAVRRQFRHFLAPDVVEEISRDPTRYLRPGGEERELTIMFCDVRKFSTVSQNMTSQELITFLNDFLTPISDVIIEHGGTIDKYIGDAIMAFWNAPKERADHRLQAIEAALAMQRTGARLNADWKAAGMPEMSFGIGLNTGLCSVGSIGSRRRLDYTCIGDAVNVASRLEGLTKQYGVDLCVAESVVQGAGGVAAIELDMATVVGRADRHERIYTVLAQPGPDFAVTKSLAQRALAAYRDQEFLKASALFSELGAAESQLAGYADVMAERSVMFRMSPPPRQWDGVFRAREK